MESNGWSSKSERFIFGLGLLLAFNACWGITAEISKFLYGSKTHNKPFMCTYLKTSMLTVYLIGCVFSPHWRRHRHSTPHSKTSSYIQLNIEDNENCPEVDSDMENVPDSNGYLSNPEYIPIKMDTEGAVAESIEASQIDEEAKNSDSEEERAVRFNRLAEVRQMSDCDATEALIARLSYQATLRADYLITKERTTSLPMARIAKLALISTPIWFLANYNYHIALVGLNSEVLTVFTLSASVFTLFLAASFPSGPTDGFSLTKLCVIIWNLIGLMLFSFTDITHERNLPLVNILSILSALFYAIYIVSVRRQMPTTTDHSYNIPLFLGLLGFFTALFLWPMFLILHYNQMEVFEWPTKQELIYMLFFNGLLNTVLYHSMWLWACFLTSSLMGVVAMGVAIPLSVMPDVVSKEFLSSPLIRFSVTAILVAFLLMAFITYFERSDPIGNWMYCLYFDLYRWTTNLSGQTVRVPRFRFGEKASEQTESLISSENHEA